MNEVKERIKAYLDERAAKDELFAKSYAKEKKSIDECLQFIIGEARKEAVNIEGGKGAFLCDEKVFGWAVHYYDEDDIKIAPVRGDVKVRTDMSEPAPVMPKGKPERGSRRPKTPVEYKPTRKDREKAREAAMRKLEAEELKKLRAPRKRHVEVTSNQMTLFDL